mmetsp:Transcript_20681/g.28772  ORF Transcript_20681/g.28772 Transcript_20681/m.28772 type:complete len:314 (-) Transcript_20681:155-1096(-)
MKLSAFIIFASSILHILASSDQKENCRVLQVFGFQPRLKDLADGLYRLNTTVGAKVGGREFYSKLDDKGHVKMTIYFDSDRGEWNIGRKPGGNTVIAYKASKASPQDKSGGKWSLYQGGGKWEKMPLEITCVSANPTHQEFTKKKKKDLDDGKLDESVVVPRTNNNAGTTHNSSRKIDDVPANISKDSSSPPPPQRVTSRAGSSDGETFPSNHTTKTTMTTNIGTDNTRDKTDLSGGGSNVVNNTKVSSITNISDSPGAPGSINDSNESNDTDNDAKEETGMSLSTISSSSSSSSKFYSVLPPSASFIAVVSS